MKQESERKLEYNLLVVDDEVEITKSIHRQFRSKYNVFSALSAEEAYSTLLKEHIHVVISDQRMPVITGVEFFTRIKQDYPDAVRIILTGYSDIEAVIGAINEGQIFRYITKPWNPIELDSIIKEAFDKYELITNNRRLMNSLQEANLDLEKKVKSRTIELEETNKKLTLLNIEKNKYIGIVAHDLRNPIGTAQSFSSLLIEENNYPNEKIRKFLSIINERCTFALNLISEFLDISKIESGIIDLKLKNLNYLNFVEEVVNQNRLFAESKSQTIEVKTFENKIELKFDKDKVEQVINNLLSNAIKYSFPGKKILVNISVKDNFVVTEVRDQGQGIPANELNDIFNPFKTASVKTTADEKSTGLGLTIVKKLIEAHNGTITVESEVGSGSCFTFTLPLST